MSGEIEHHTTSGPSPGAVLAAARAAQALTVENVAGRLKLASFQIKAIEADDFSTLPGAVFARGFVRNYARLLNLDAEPLMLAMAQHGMQASLPKDARLLRDATGVSLDKTARFRRLSVAAVVVAGMVTLSLPSFAVLAARIVGNVVPPSVESDILTFAAFTGAAAVPEVFQVMVCAEFIA